MTSRRIISNEQTILDKDSRNAIVSGPSTKSDTTPAVPAHVIYKLLGFTAAMMGGPIATYFLTIIAKFGTGNSTYAGATAAIIANVVLIAYIVVAMREDEGEKLAVEDKRKKGE